MADIMEFPNSVEEFMDRYKVVDTDGVYMSKGSEMVPIFRMKQWFEHASAHPEPTLYGYPIEHLEMIARVMAKENCTPEVVAEMLQNVGNVVRMVRDEMLEMLEESVSMI